MVKNMSAGNGESRGGGQTWRLLIVGSLAVIILVGLVFVVATVTWDSQLDLEKEQVNALAKSDDEYVVCHQDTTPGIVQQIVVSTFMSPEHSYLSSVQGFWLHYQVACLTMDAHSNMGWVGLFTFLNGSI